ncbi:MULTISPECIES: DUF2059 domain-containing protein [Marinobacter]|jgi:hypothetical protein|uniref:DUF2059 domain-containing protein n=2 Tax=Marinobacter nauticus TaxID=2743 RepID=A0A368UX01_MARNT|nr:MULTISPECIES: DUF2059 domain-containing protein [Marinobacter]ABM19959.1 conserved hypothetical protein [Marinobacter nauticus VT8]MAC22416.1 DUF2059 domain-containing protein [Marinobacter sp.]MAH31366.1 DUF2059 domain-containing protein [Marinobacter sp.]MBH91913.1 DUF2059 domain-containing protein [Marinobacter sp.]MBU41311.1 DUF2059 domain-containing protein [Marinobacter sp.]|tara:strand:+ start:2606 stop:3433 length:828 start_codon:yes stop_codon:yes gene_type:complete
MKRLALVKPVLVVAMLGVGSAQAAPDAASVLEASPIDDIVEQYPAMLSQGIREGLKQRGQVPPMVADTVGYVVSSSFSADKIEQQIITDLQAQLTDEQLQAVSEWYQTPVARKISSAEIAASAPEAWPQIQASAPELNRKYKGTPKAEMFDRFDRAARATESAVDTTIAVQLGLATAMSALSSESMHYEQLERRIENQRGMLRGVVGQQVYDSYLYTYDKISAQELALYLDFLESPAGKQFSQVVTSSIQQAIMEPVESIGRQISRFMAPPAGSE